MKKLLAVVILSLFLVPVCLAEGVVPVLVIDSGSDFTHPLLNPLADPNQVELNGTGGIDDSGNGYVDDIYGWNFPNNNNVLCNLDNTPPRYDDVITFMNLIGIYQQVGRDNMDPADFKLLVKLYNDKELTPWNSFTGGWAHGTHCAGVIATDNKAPLMKAVRHLNTGEPPEKKAEEMLMNFTLMYRPGRSRTRSIDENPMLPELIAYFKEMGQKGAEEIEPEAKYVGSLNPRVVNCSFGVPNEALLKSFKDYMTQQWNFTNPTDKEVQDMVNLYVTHTMLPSDKVFYSYMKDALIVFAAGNSSENYENVVTSPISVDITNKLVVAATNKDESLADFSCYGKNIVEVAVPGVNIMSSFPNGRMGAMSGTSMAAPMAAKFATMVFAENKYLTPEQVKEILMRTVDKKTWLADKIVSGGVINVDRAVAAARFMRETKTLDEAITKALQEIDDKKPDSIRGVRPPRFETEFEKELYKSSIW